MLDFFISYTSADEAWAEWIAWVLEAAGLGRRVKPLRQRARRLAPVRRRAGGGYALAAISSRCRSPC